MKVFKEKLLKPLLFAVSVIVFAVVRFNKAKKSKKVSKKC